MMVQPSKCWMSSHYFHSVGIKTGFLIFFCVYKNLPLLFNSKVLFVVLFFIKIILFHTSYITKTKRFSFCRGLRFSKIMYVLSF